MPSRTQESAAQKKDEGDILDNDLYSVNFLDMLAEQVSVILYIPLASFTLSISNSKVITSTKRN